MLNLQIKLWNANKNNLQIKFSNINISDITQFELK